MFKYISAVEKEVVWNKHSQIPAIEITSFEQLCGLSDGTEVAIMYNMTMVLGKVDSKRDGLVFIWDNERMIPVYPNSFKYGNFMYELV